MPLADYKLPVKGALQDGPPSGDLDFFRKLDIQQQGLIHMYNERAEIIKFYPGQTSPLNIVKIFATAGGTVTSTGGLVAFGGNAFFWQQGLTPPMVTAVPAPGFSFVGWGGDLGGTGLTMSLPDIEWAGISANFKKTGDPDPAIVSYIPMTDVAGWFTTLRQLVQDLIHPGFTTHGWWVNQSVHPAGDISGASVITYWDVDTALIEAGVPTTGPGSPPLWTRFPNSDPFGYTFATGALSPLGQRTPSYKQHVNEIIDVLTVLKYAVFAGNFLTGGPLKTGSPAGVGMNVYEKDGFSGDQATCDDAKSAALSDWTAFTPFDTGSPQPAELTGITSQGTPGVFTAQLRSREMKFYADLLAYTGPFRLFGFFHFNGNSSVAVQGYTGNDTYQLIDTQAAPQDYASPTMAPFSSAPDFPATCPDEGSLQVGWIVDLVGPGFGTIGSVIVIAPVFDLP